jgi:short-subunit dehydrogenase
MSEKWAFITGASSGIGRSFAIQAASMGYNLVISARRQEILNDLADELSARYHIQAEFISADLSEKKGIVALEERIRQMPNLELLINNAGFGTRPLAFWETDKLNHDGMMNVHMNTSVMLTYAALPGMVANRKGAVILLSSIGAFMPVTGNVTYCSTKSFLVTFAQSLSLELEGTGVRVQALCPGFTHTGFHDTKEYEGLNVKSNVPDWLWMSANDVVAASFRALDKGKIICIPGWFNYGMIWASRLGLLKYFADKRK